MVSVLLLRPSIIFFLLSPLALAVSDSDALLKLKKSFTNVDGLESWNSDSSPCTIPWVGVICFKGIIMGLRLEQMGLSGEIDVDALIGITGLRSLSFMNNSFSGPIPEFNRLGALKAIYLSGNKFSGEIPSDYFLKMESLKKVWLSNNEFTGAIPTSLSKISHLMELHLENNQFSGKIPPIEQSTLVSLNLSNNKLEGEIPLGLSKFNESSFVGNIGLCGTQLGKECNVIAEGPTPTIRGSTETAQPSHHVPEITKAVASMLFLILVLIVLVIAAIVVLKRRKEDFDVLGRENLDEPVQMHVSSSGSNRKAADTSRRGADSSRKGSQNGKGNGMGDLVVVNDEKGVFGLPDLMQAAAEVLGNGSLGSAYKAVMTSGVAVVVKRMKEMNRVSKDGFDAEMRRFGRLRHRNILTPLAYHYRKEEKLLVSEYAPKGSLLYLLHGDRGAFHAELNWPTRLKIIQGIARGMGFLHTELASYNLPHGNLKSSNVLLSLDYEPLLVDYGFVSVVNTNQAAQALFAYKAPESVQCSHVSPKCDVYCLGIVILEILTGKFPSQYVNNGTGGTDIVQWFLSAISENREIELLDPEIANSRNSLGSMERVLHIGAACVEQNPDQRLDMREAIRRIEEIQVEGLQESSEIQLSQSVREDEFSSSPSHAFNVLEVPGEHSARRSG